MREFTHGGPGAGTASPMTLHDFTSSTKNKTLQGDTAYTSCVLLYGIIPYPSLTWQLFLFHDSRWETNKSDYKQSGKQWHPCASHYTFGSYRYLCINAGKIHSKSCLWTYHTLGHTKTGHLMWSGSFLGYSEISIQWPLLHTSHLYFPM